MTVLRMVRGDSASFDLTLEAGGSAIDLTDADAVAFTASSTVWAGATDADGNWSLAPTDLSIEKILGDGVTVNEDPTTGKLTVALDPADTADLTADQCIAPFDWAIAVTVGSTVTTADSGVLVIRALVPEPAS